MNVLDFVKKCRIKDQGPQEETQELFEIYKKYKDTDTVISEIALLAIHPSMKENMKKVIKIINKWESESDTKKTKTSKPVDILNEIDNSLTRKLYKECSKYTYLRERYDEFVAGNGDFDIYQHELRCEHNPENEKCETCQYFSKGSIMCVNQTHKRSWREGYKRKTR